MSRKGAVDRQKNGRLHTQAHAQSISAKDSKFNDVIVHNGVFSLPSATSKAVQGRQNGGRTVLLPIDAVDFLPPGAAPSSASPSSDADDSVESATDALRSIVSIHPPSASCGGEGSIEWLRATTDHDLIHIGFDVRAEDAQLGDKTGEIGDLFTSVNHCSMPTGGISLLATSSTIQNAVSSSSGKGKTSLEAAACGDGTERVASRLSLQERACLEEIERGSQLTPEERELFESHDLQVGGSTRYWLLQ